MTFIYRLAHIGEQFATGPSERRSILLSNIVSLVLFGLGMVLFAAYYVWYGMTVVTVVIPLVAVLCLSTLLLNHVNRATFSRLWLCMLVPLAALSLSVYAKRLYYDQQEELDYFTFRFIILSSCVFPAIFFSFRERGLLIFSTVATYVLLMLHDPIHDFFDVPYRDHVLKQSNYFFTNVVITISYTVLAAAVLFLKKLSEDHEARADQLINELNQINEELVEKNVEIEAQNSEISAQAENLNISQNRLQSAYQVIEDQKDLLLKQNRNLSSELVDINDKLTASNTELVKHNNELRQFSYTVSHNLRGPVASLMGLINLFNSRELNAENTEILEHAKTSMQRLDAVIKDLSKIIDIRQDIFHIRQKINLKTEIDEILLPLQKEIERHQIKIIVQIDDPEIYSVKPMVHSILYNLISNAIKYRAPGRAHEIIISASKNNYYRLEVRDNGLGIDLKAHRHNLFKLYKRFHYHTEGKGLGLYLVKLQAEALGGRVEVESELNKYTRFVVYLGQPQNVERQILHEESYAHIFYDAQINSTGVIWNGPVSGEQYRSVFTKCLEFVKVYNTPYYISDLSRQGYISREDQLWMFQYIMPEAARHGLKAIAGIRPDKDDPKIEEYLNGITENMQKLGLTQEFFLTFEEAVTWIAQLNEKASLNIER